MRRTRLTGMVVALVMVIALIGFGVAKYWRRGEVISVTSQGDSEITIEVLLEDMEASDEVYYETSDEPVTIHIALESPVGDSEFNIKMLHLTEGVWHSYKYGGVTLEDAYNNR